MLGFGVRGPHAAVPAAPDQALFRRPAPARIDGRGYADLVPQAETSSTARAAPCRRSWRGRWKTPPKHGFRARRALARPHSRHEPDLGAPGREPGHVHRRRCVRHPSGSGRVLRAGVLLPRRAELGQPPVLPAPRARGRSAAKCWALSWPVLRHAAAAAADPAVARHPRARAAGRGAALKADRKVEIAVPQRGEKREIVAAGAARTRARSWPASRRRTPRSARFCKAWPKPSASRRRRSASRSTTIRTSRARTRSAP